MLYSIDFMFICERGKNKKKQTKKQTGEHERVEFLRPVTQRRVILPCFFLCFFSYLGAFLPFLRVCCKLTLVKFRNKSENCSAVSANCFTAPQTHLCGPRKASGEYVTTCNKDGEAAALLTRSVRSWRGTS